MEVYLVWSGDGYHTYLESIHSDKDVAIEVARARYDEATNYDGWLVSVAIVDSTTSEEMKVVGKVVWDSEKDGGS